MTALLSSIQSLSQTQRLWMGLWGRYSALKRPDSKTS